MGSGATAVCGDGAHIRLSRMGGRSVDINQPQRRSGSDTGFAGGGVGSKEAAAAALRRRSVESSSTGIPILQPGDYLGKHARPASGMRGSQRSPAPSAEPSAQNSNKANAKPSSAKQNRKDRSAGQIGSDSSLSAIVSQLAAQLEAAERQLKTKDARIAELSVQLESYVQDKAHMTSARRAAKDAVKEMADQNTKLIRAYLEKKREIKEFHKLSHEDRKRDALLELLREENAQLRAANISLRTRLNSAAGHSSSSGTTVSTPTESSKSCGEAHYAAAPAINSSGVEATPRAAPKRSLTPKTLRIVSLEDHNRRLCAENGDLRSEQEAMLHRTVQRDKVEHYKRLGTLAFQKHNHEEALKHFSDAIAVCDSEDHNSATLYSNRAACHLCMSNHIASIYDSSLAIVLDPCYPRSYRRRADAFVAVGDYFSATADLEKMKEMGAWPLEMQSTVDKLLALCSKAAPVNHYKVLGVTPTANEQEIRAAFKSAALKFHPDKAPDGMWRAAAEVVFRLVSEASRVLSDANNRAEYDKVVAAESQRRGSPSTSK